MLRVRKCHTGIGFLNDRKNMISFGSDPEFILKSNAGIQSAIGIVPGSKEKRHKAEGHSFFHDNVLAECSIKPAYSKEEAIENFRECFQLYSELVKPYELWCKSSARFPSEALKHPEALEMGCKREACAYELDWVESDETFFHRSNLRTAGGHIHLGHEILKNQLVRIRTVRMMDLFLGIPSIFLDGDKASKERKKIYGEAGRFREPLHGLEYRTLSNFWLATPELVGLMYDLSNFTVEFVKDNRDEKYWNIDYKKLESDEFWNEDGDPVNCHSCTGYSSKRLRDAIKKSNKSTAIEGGFLKILENELPKHLYERISKHIGYSKVSENLFEWGITC